jgi:hypothetical protein
MDARICVLRFASQICTFESVKILSMAIWSILVNVKGKSNNLVKACGRGIDIEGFVREKGKVWH